MAEETLFDCIQSFGNDEETLNDILKMPFAQEFYEKKLNIEKLSPEEIILALKTASYLNINGKDLLDEFFRKIGDEKHDHDYYFEHESELVGERDFYPKQTCPKIILNELLIHYGKPPYYGEKLSYRKTTAENASLHGNLWLLKFLLKDSDKKLYKICSNAAMNGHLECLKYAHENGCEWNEYTCAYAAFNGHLHCLKYAHENGCKWNNYTCSSAAGSGHLECLKYAHENGCEWDRHTTSAAAKFGHADCLKFARENGCE